MCCIQLTVRSKSKTCTRADTATVTVIFPGWSVSVIQKTKSFKNDFFSVQMVIDMLSEDTIQI